MNADRLYSFQDATVLVFGDFMVDEYVIGSVKRISPEAPVPVLQVSEKRRVLGGAGNVAHNLAALGAHVRVCGWVGDDNAGAWLYQALEEIGINTDNLIANENVFTTIKTRYAAKNQQFLRCDEEVIQDPTNDQIESLLAAADHFLDGVDVLLISDYAKGSVCAAACEGLIRKANSRSIPIVVDPKGSQYDKYRGATACTPNMKELEDCLGAGSYSDDALAVATAQLAETYDFKYVFLTRSENGITLYSCNGGRSDYPALKKEVVDVSGAGDTVASTIALCFAAGLDSGEACQVANLAASVVCSKFGTATLTLEELKEAARGDEVLKYVDLPTARNLIREAHRHGQKVVFTNGCFDLIHYGHISSFKQARSFGDLLIVAVNSDDSVRRLKGPKRPIVGQKDRIGMLCALECVDYVLLMNDDTPADIVRTLQPDIIVKGRDWEAKGIPESKIVEEYGGEVRFVDLEKGLSTTHLIDKVVGQYADK